GLALHQIEVITITQNVQPDVIDTQHAFQLFFRQTGIRDCAAIDDVDRPGADHTQSLLFFYDDSGIFVDTDAEILRILCDCPQQTTDAPAFGKVRVDDDFTEKSSS